MLYALKKKELSLLAKGSLEGCAAHHVTNLYILAKGAACTVSLDARGDVARAIAG